MITYELKRHNINYIIMNIRNYIILGSYDLAVRVI